MSLEIISNLILKDIDKNINNEDIIEKTYLAITTMFENYNQNTKIDGYNYKKTKLDSKNLPILNIKEFTLKALRKHKTLNTFAKNEFVTLKPKHLKDVFNIIKVDTDLKILLFLTYSIFYLLDSLHHKKYVIGLDFEFNRRKIALIQISFFPSRKNKFIFVLDPSLFKSQYIDIMIETVFVSKLYRIVHGSDSLDIPYIFEELFMKDSEKILKFTKNVIDTRFICEYFKIFTHENNNKCSIYDALLFFKTISNEKYTELNEINDSMGPIQDVNWNLKKMSSFNLKYASYDVLFLDRFVRDMFNKKKTDVILSSQLKLIPFVERFVILEKYGINDIVLYSKKMTDPIHNFLVKTKDKNSSDYIISRHKSKNDDQKTSLYTNRTLISIYNSLIEHMSENETDLNPKYLLDINYFKTPLSTVFKRITYSAISEYYKIYENKNTLYTEKITFKEIYKTLINSNLGVMVSIFEKFYNQVKMDIGNIL